MNEVNILMKKVLNIAFVWHMHQPYYKDILTNEVSLPWVRLHGIKDYLDMASILKGFPNIKQTFNLVPSLIDQIEEYTKSPLNIKEKFLDITRKRTEDLDEKDKEFILFNFFMCNWGTMIEPYKRYHDLLVKRGRFVQKNKIARIVKEFSAQDFLDLVVWFNLVWFDPIYRHEDKNIGELFIKGSNFTEEDKEYIINKQISILNAIIPTYKEMSESGQIELSVTPYFHPILPLIVDSDVAKECMGWAELPKKFSHPQDASWHVQNAIKTFEKHFGYQPKGMWPAEGSVSEGILELLVQNGIKWIATDEEILFKTFKMGKSHRLYKPYSLMRKFGDISIIFRDHALSDSVGFVYQRWNPHDAVKDFTRRLEKIREEIQNSGQDNNLVSIILDGENAWEYYPNDGRDFLLLLYNTLNNDPSFNITTVDSYLKHSPPNEKIEWLYPGSWINGDFSIWTGEAEKNTSWDYLSKTRNDLVYFENSLKDIPQAKFDLAWREIYIAEGSDWNWWYGPHHSSGNDDEFDRLYRKHLSNVYTILGKDIPKYIDVPIISKELKPLRTPRRFFKPTIDGKATDYFEWLEAGHFDVSKMGGTMHQVESIIRNIYYGFDIDNLYLRLDLKVPEEFLTSKDLVVGLYIPHMQIKFEIPINNAGKIDFLLKKWAVDRYETIRAYDTACFKEILEFAIPFGSIDLKSGIDLKFNVQIEKGELIMEKRPDNTLIKITVPNLDFEAYNWHV